MQMAFYYFSSKMLYTAWVIFCPQHFIAERYIYKYVSLNTSGDVLIIYVSGDFSKTIRQDLTSTDAWKGS